MSLAHALKWSFLAEIATKAVQPVVFIVLARLLAPEDFGVMSAALMVIAFSQIFWEGGMGKALVQWQGDIDKAANVAFWINLVLGVLTAALLLSMADPVARHIFHDARVAPVIQAMALMVILGALGSVHTALLQKSMDFRELFWVRFATVSLPGLASLPMAWQGMGYWALVVGTLAGQAIQVVLLWRGSRWRPTPSFDAQVAGAMGNFGIWVSMSALLAWFYVWADALIVGIYLGSHELGLFRTGNQLTTMGYAILFSALNPVLYSHFSRTTDRRMLTAMLHKAMEATALVAIPVALTIFFFSDVIGNLLFDHRWESIGLVIGVMALSNGFAWIVGMNGEAYRAINRPQHETVVMLLALAAYLPIYLYAVGHGLQAFLWSRLLATAIGIGIQLFFAWHLLSLPVGRLLARIARIILVTLICTLPMHVPRLDIWGATPASIHLLAGLISIGLLLAVFYRLERNGLLKDVREQFFAVKRSP